MTPLLPFVGYELAISIFKFQTEISRLFTKGLQNGQTEHMPCSPA